MPTKILSYFTLSLLLLLNNSSGNSTPQSRPKGLPGLTGTLEKMIVTRGDVAFDLDFNRLNGTARKKPRLDTFHFQVDPNSFFTILVFDHQLRGPTLSSMGLIRTDSAVLPEPLNTSSNQLIIEKIPSSEPFDLVVRDGKTGFTFFNIEGHSYEYDAAARSLGITGGRLLISEEFANMLGRPADAGLSAGRISIAATVYPIEVTIIAGGAIQSSILPPRSGVAPSAPEGAVPGPDVIVGDLPSMGQFGNNGTQVGLGVGTTSCNNGDQPLDWFSLPATDHPVIPQNFYRMSGGTANNDRFEQVGQSWLKHAFFALEDDACGFGCNTSGCSTGSQLCVACSDPYDASLNAEQTGLGSRAWVNPFTGVFPSNAANHSGHNHTGTSHRLRVEISDLNTTTNPGATYFAESQYITPHEYTWCQAHPGQCNMYNNASYRRFNVSGTTSFTFSPVGSTVRMTPAINAWTGATINPIEPVPGTDGRAFIGYKVTGPVAGLWHYEYAIYNQNLDRAIQSFSLPLGCGITVSNLGFHAPLNDPGVANDGTQGNAGFSNAPWPSTQTISALSWSTETFVQNPNANALRWGTLYNFRFDSNGPPQTANATIGFFKTGTPISVGIQGPSAEPCAATPTPSPTLSPGITPSPTPTSTPSATPTPCTGSVIFSENFDGLPVGTPGPCSYISNVDPDTPPNDLFFADQDGINDCVYVFGNISIPTVTSVFRFRNNFNTEFSSGVYWDGGVLEVSAPSISGGAFLDITDPLVGGSFVTGGYTGEIDGTANNPLAGRMAWSGDSVGYIDSVINLGPNLVGQTVSLRFRFGSDAAVGAPGWRIDTLVITDGVCPTPSPTPTPTATPCTGTVIWSENFDGVVAPALPAGWVATNPDPGDGVMWVTSTTTPDTAPNAAFIFDQDGISDKVLDSPPINIPTAAAQLRFRNNFNTEFSGGIFCDGGMLEVSSPNISGGDFLDITDPQVGGSFERGGYTGDIGCGPQPAPTPKRMGWVGDSGGYIDTVINLGPNLAGQTVTFRFRFVSDSAVEAPGWRVDTMSIIDGVCPTPTPSPTATVTPTATPIPLAQPLNISTRLRVGTGSDIGIAGFIVGGGTDSKRILVRGIGPSLTAFGVPGALADPTLELRDLNGALILGNDDWRDTQEAEIQATGIAPTSDLESALVATVQPGNSTALLAGKDNTQGVGLVEVYDLGPADSQLVNISTRAFVGTGGEVVIGGFILGGGGNTNVVIRGIGPSLSDFGVPNPLADPTLELRDNNGALLASNDNCTGSSLPPTDPLEACIEIPLSSGAYTAILAGKNGGTGVGLVEIYNLN